MHFLEATHLGEKNKELIPSVKQWCKHIAVSGRLASMMGQMMNIPMSTSIGCRHAKNEAYEGPNLEWNARDFIIENCLECPKHEPLSGNNFGLKTANEYYERTRQQEADVLVEEDLRLRLLNDAETLIKKVKTSAEVKILSIINLVQKLNDPEQAAETATRLLEAAKISPEFFSEAAIGYLAIFTKNKQLEKTIFETIAILQQNGQQLSPFTIKLIISAIENEIQTDISAGIWAHAITDAELVASETLMEAVISNCDYRRIYGFHPDKAGSYPQTITILERFYQTDQPKFESIITGRLKNKDRETRININGLLTDLIESGKCVLLLFAPLLIRSLEFSDSSRSGDSADYRTIKTLIALYKVHPVRIQEISGNEALNLSGWGKAELVRLYEEVIIEDELYKVNAACAGIFLERLIEYLMHSKSSQELKEASMHAIERIQQSRTELLDPYFESFVGHLILLNSDRTQFKWYREDAANPARPAASFNPLVGKSFLDIQHIEQDMHNCFRGTANLITKSITRQPDKHFEGMAAVLEKLDSKTEGAFKSKIIEILQKGLKDIVSVSKLLPAIYGYLQDPDSEEVRGSGMTYVIHILIHFPQLATQTFVDLVKIFLKDLSVGVRGRAIAAYGLIIREFPEYVEVDCFEHIRSLLFDKYVFVHHAAADFAYNAYPFLEKNDLMNWMNDILTLEHHYYKEKDLSYGLELTRILLFLSGKLAATCKNITQQILIKYCDTKDYHTDRDALTELTSLARKNQALADIWIKEATGFLTRSQPAPNSSGNDERKEFIDFFYTLPEDLIRKNKELLLAFARDKISRLKDRVMIDLVDIYAILAYFCLWEELLELTRFFKKTVPDTKPLAYAHKFNQQAERISVTEHKVASASLDRSHIQQLIHAQL
ncbi:hypothetical protein IWX76_000050 [Pedobacter sp. CAN_A7]|uniref:hypothetical protein n=1 Tax=Pedobacter sp. CAN_A7 TaxID=2787722 RepID=UPI0018C9BFC2